MKKIRFLVLALAVAIMLMGAGYAYWQETLTIENTITTGALEFEFIGGSVDVAEFMDEDNSYCVVGQDDNEVLIKLAQMYPGAQATVNFEIKNTGTMDAKLKNFRIQNMAQEILDMDYIEIVSFKIGENVIVNDPIDVNHFNTISTPVALTKGDTAEIELVIGINKDANEIQIAESYDAYNFTLIFDGLQWNDNEH